MWRCEANWPQQRCELCCSSASSWRCAWTGRAAWSTAASCGRRAGACGGSGRNATLSWCRSVDSAVVAGFGDWHCCWVFVTYSVFNDVKTSDCHGVAVVRILYAANSGVGQRQYCSPGRAAGVQKWKASGIWKKSIVDAKWLGVACRWPHTIAVRNYSKLVSTSRVLSGAS